MYSRSAQEQERNLRSPDHRQAMSDVEEDSVSLRTSLRSQDPSLASVSDSRRTSLSDFIFSFDREVTESNLIAASVQPQSDVKLPLLDSKEATSNNESVTGTSPRPQRSGLSHIFQTPFRKGFISSHRKLSLGTFKGIVRSPPAFPPVVKVSHAVDVTQEQRTPVNSDRVKLLLAGVGCSGKTTLRRSIALLCNGKLQHLQTFLTPCLVQMDLFERKMEILSCMEEAGLPLNFEDDSIIRALLKSANPYRRSDERIAYNKEDSVAFSSGRPSLEELSRWRWPSSAAGKLLTEKELKAAFDRASREVYIEKDTALYVRQSTKTPDADMK